MAEEATQWQKKPPMAEEAHRNKIK